MRKRLLIGLAVIGLVLTGCSDEGSEPKKMKAKLVTEAPQLIEEETASPAVSEIDDLSSGRFYVKDDKLVELVCLVNGSRISSVSGKKIGKVGRGFADFNGWDSYYQKNIALTWKISGEKWKLESDDWVFGRYKELVREGNYVFGVSEYYFEKDGILFYHSSNSSENSLEVTVAKGVETWSIATSELINFVEKKDSSGRTYYEQELVLTD